MQYWRHCAHHHTNGTHHPHTVYTTTPMVHSPIPNPQPPHCGQHATNGTHSPTLKPTSYDWLCSGGHRSIFIPALLCKLKRHATPQRQQTYRGTKAVTYLRPGFFFANLLSALMCTCSVCACLRYFVSGRVLASSGGSSSISGIVGSSINSSVCGSAAVRTRVCGRVTLTHPQHGRTVLAKLGLTVSTSIARISF